MTENKQYQELEYQTDIKENNEIQIDWISIFRQIIVIRKKLYKAAIIGIIIGVIIAFSIPKQYTVSVTLSPEMGSSKSNNGLASMAASFLGGNIGSDSPDALNATLTPDIVASTPFLLELLNSRVITKDNNDTTFTAYLEEMKAPWWKTILQVPGMVVGGIKSLFDNEVETTTETIGVGSIELSTKDAAKLTSLRQLITADVDKKTAITTLSVTLQDPKVTATVADSVISKLQQYITIYHNKKRRI